MASLLSAALMPAALAEEPVDPNKSPSLCGPGDTPESGIQGDVAPAGGVHCGLTLLSEVPGGGPVQGAGTCAYVRTSTAALGASVTSNLNVIDLGDPANPTVVSTLPLADPAEPPRDEGDHHLAQSSETMRAVVTNERAVLVTGRSVFDIRNCKEPKLG